MYNNKHFSIHLLLYLISKQKNSSRLDNKAKSRFHLRILSFYRLIYGISIFCLPVFIVFVPFFCLKNFNVIQWGRGYYGTEDYGTARVLFAQTLDLFIFRALRDRGLRDTSKATK